MASKLAGYGRSNSRVRTARSVEQVERAMAEDRGESYIALNNDIIGITPEGEVLILTQIKGGDWAGEPRPPLSREEKREFTETKLRNRFQALENLLTFKRPKHKNNEQTTGKKIPGKLKAK